MNYRHVAVKNLNDIFARFRDENMLLTAIKPDGSFNAMTAGYGGIGAMWTKTVAFVPVRKQRYTYEFMEEGEIFTLSFLRYSHRRSEIFKIMGSQSGRDTDKIANAGLTVVREGEAVFFEEADLVLVCKKLYADFFRAECFAQPCEGIYPGRDFHKNYIGEVIDVIAADAAAGTNGG